MRKNIFLHFMNRDTREIFDLYRLLSETNHALRLREPLNAAAMLCEDACIAPPGFVIEDQIAFELFENQSAYLDKGLIKLPIRETSLVDYAEKKRGEYAPARDRYSGLFNDARLQRLGSFGDAIISRKVQIGSAIVDGFQGGVDTRAPAWKIIRQKANADVIANMRNVPSQLADQGKALTWSIIRPDLLSTGEALHGYMRSALQNVYFKEYCKEFNLLILSQIPFMIDDFSLPVDKAVYSFRRLKLFLDCFDSTTMFLRASAGFITELRGRAGFIDLMDAYVAMSNRYQGDTELRYHTDRAVRKSSFRWDKLSVRLSGSLSDPTAVEILEIADACGDLATIINSEHGFLPRSNLISDNARTKKLMASKGPHLKIALFVALEEELEVLVRQLKLTRAASRPAASGQLGSVQIDVLCPRAMGRVAAAVETTKYLGGVADKPDLIICIGLAGGFSVAQGGVICVDTVVDLANRKVTDDANGQAHSKFRREDYHCARALYAVAKSSEFNEEKWGNECRSEFEWPKGTTPSLWEGKIASVDEVVASKDHTRSLTENVEKLLGVEMQAGGVCAAAKSFNVKFEVLRVVSDMADPAKTDDHWRSVGMKTLAELLKRLPLDRVIAVTKE